jgi:hypothetical protein
MSRASRRLGAEHRNEKLDWSGERVKLVVVVWWCMPQGIGLAAGF